MSEPQQPPAQPHGTPPQFAGSHYPPQPAQPSQPPQPSQPDAGQPYGGQAYAGHPYPAQPYPEPQRAASSGSSGLGRLAFLLAVISLGIGLLVTLSFPLMYRMMGDPSAIGAFGAVGNGLVLIIAVVGLILGLMSVRRPGPQILAGIAIGVTASQLAGIVISWVSNLFYAFSF
ncbi:MULTISPECIES: hypothetical protein [Microbacterium]|uniref:hypothetical protein n=1 Tax=Microbacterium TaxID=33882 RepID=UPI0012947583|nr:MULTISPECIES: hypothetical protein [Microbacterium]